MTTPDFIIALFYAVDQEMLEVPKHPDATLSPSEVVTLALLHAMQRRRDPRLLPLADARLSAVVAAGAGAHPFGTALQDPHGMDRPLAGGPDGAGRSGHLRDCADSPHAGRAEPSADWHERLQQSSVDGRGEAVFYLDTNGA